MASKEEGETSSAEDNDEEAEVELARQARLSERRAVNRSSVCGEHFVAKAGWTPPVNAKTTEQANKIRLAVSKSFLFKSLEPANLQQVVDAFAGPHVLAPGDEVIREGAMVELGEPGLYVLEEGKLDVFQMGANRAYPGNKVFTYDEMGQSFGELALMYNCPRAATVVASSPSVVWSIDRDTFNHCVKEGYRLTRQRRVEFINSVEILTTLTEDERMNITDVMKTRTCHQGEMIIRAGGQGTEFFIVEEGAASASSSGQVVKQYRPGDYFGELALLRSQPRQVDVIATATPTVLACLDADTFRRVCGNLGEILAERAKDYVPIHGGPDQPRQGDSFLERLFGGFCSSCSNAAAAKSSVKTL